MPLPNESTAVLLFALPDAVEAGRKAITRQPTAVWRAMRALTQAKVQASGLPLLKSNQLIDHRGTFGEQLSAALSAAFARGYEHIICIGNDSPDLSVTDLRRASQALSRNQLPLGADRRGGVYIVGFSREQFDAQDLVQLPWQTNQLADALRGYFRDLKITFSELPVRADINQAADATLVQWTGQSVSRLLLIIRQALLVSGIYWPFFLPAFSFSLTYLPLSGRAPPRG